MRPNIISIITDDQGYWAMGCAGNAEIRTPNLDRLATTGIRFENCFCVTPVCSAARASILTGSIPSCHGVHDFLLAGPRDLEDHDIEFLKEIQGYTDLLAASGYVCGHTGKWHMGDMSYPQKGYTFWRPKGDSYMDCRFYDEEGNRFVREGYVTDRITDYAIEFLEDRKGDEQPFYLNICYNAPHSPWEREHHPPDVWDGYYEDCSFESCPYPPIHPWDAGLTDFWVHPRRRREKLAGYFTAITCMDAAVGRLLDWLEANGMRESALVFFTSDNGMNMGHHGINGKGNGTRPLNMYDTSVKVPGLVSMPGTVQEGVVNDALISHYDLFPTFLELAGVENLSPERLPGRSFARILPSRSGGLCGPSHQPPLPPGEVVPTAPAAGVGTGEGSIVVYDEYGYTRMIRSREWKYVHRYPGGPHELYDLVGDPDEERNMVDNPACAERVADMRDQLGDWFSRYVTDRFDGTKLQVTGCGQRGWADAPDAFAQTYPASWLAYRDEMAGRFREAGR